MQSSNQFQITKNRQAIKMHLNIQQPIPKVTLFSSVSVGTFVPTPSGTIFATLFHSLKPPPPPPPQATKVKNNLYSTYHDNIIESHVHCEGLFLILLPVSKISRFINFSCRFYKPEITKIKKGKLIFFILKQQIMFMKWYVATFITWKKTQHCMTEIFFFRIWW